MALDPLEIEAMLIRKEAVMAMAKTIGMDGIEMLAAILIPSEDFLTASRRRAAQTGPSPLAKRISRKKPDPSPEPSEGPTLDELLEAINGHG